MASLKRGKRAALGSEKGRLAIKYGKKRAVPNRSGIGHAEVLK